MAEAPGGESPVTIIGAIVANLVIAVAKFAAAIFTGSSSMLAEAMHSVVDTGNEGLLLLGVRRSRKPADEMHPFGYGQELYFWSLVVAMALFAIGGGLSFYEGVAHLRHPEPIEAPVWNYAVLAVAFLAEGASWFIALKALRKARKNGESHFRAFRRSKDPSVYIVLAEDSAALVGIVAAAAGVWLSVTFDKPYFDGLASMVIGVVLIAVAALLVYETRSLIMGEAADPEVVASVRRIAMEEEAVAGVAHLLTMHFAPDQVLLNLELRFRPGVPAEKIFSTVERVEARIRRVHPQIGRIFVEAEAFRRGDPQSLPQAG
ncbi:cation diffusion facilitator family transporter [Mangrovicoccus sp. HB161399]|uniref:cation diffusion facilitator family transporter n=1 Tax=Mangrovicoccus sp. HB161399 TaxID=2720392 RepID=UPI001553FB78|nr:cation diffusion facilitator family transporter [Mangrovicoccus sp. HB161399]